MHAVERALIVCEGDEIGPEHLPSALRSRDSASSAKDGRPLPSLAEMERNHIVRVLESVDGHRERAARILGISERNLYRKLKAYGV
jgi:DNA-binding NtrC family response regulator